MIHNIEEIIEKLCRTTGRSTRRVDDYIQKLFEQGEIIVNDHYDNRKAHNILFDKVMRRLIFEHPNLEEIYLERDKATRCIKIDLEKLQKNRTFQVIFYAELTRDEIAQHMKQGSKLKIAEIAPQY